MSSPLAVTERFRHVEGNDLGQLGDGTFVHSKDPIQVKDLTNVVQISTHTDDNLALTKDGSVWFWRFEGRQDGQLIGRNIPLKIEGFHDVVLICASPDWLVMKRERTYWASDGENKSPNADTLWMNKRLWRCRHATAFGGCR